MRPHPGIYLPTALKNTKGHQVAPMAFNLFRRRRAASRDARCAARRIVAKCFFNPTCWPYLV
jgi:hypothetical protein